MTDRSKTVALLIDWDNLQICHSRDAPGTELDLNAVIALAQSYGTLVSSRAYAEWNIPQERLAVYKAGIEPVFAPVMRPEGSSREGKSLADTVMVADGVDLLWTVAPDVFVLVTSDKDMIPLARIAKQRGAAVVILGSDLTAIPLVELSNVFITYRQLVRELDRTSALDAPSGRAPARERRIGPETRRPSTEPFTGRPAVGPARGGQPRQAELITPPAITAPTPLPLPSAETPEESAASTEAGARRRRRRGGRSRSRGAGVGEVVAVSPEDAADDTPSELPRDEERPERESAPALLETVGPILFSEFGPPPPPPGDESESSEAVPAAVDGDGSPPVAISSEQSSVLVSEAEPSSNGASGGTGDDATPAKPARRRRAPVRRKAAAIEEAGD